MTQVVWLGVYAATFFLIAMRWRKFVEFITRDKLLLLLVAIVVLSVLWSAAPETTLRRAVALVGTTAFGAYLATRYTLDGQLKLLATALGIAAVLSLAFGLALPSYGISSDPLFVGDWQGIYNHKNTLGSDMSLGALVFLILATSMSRYRWLAWGGFVLTVCLVVLSDSSTALIALLALLALWPVYRSLRWRYTLALPFLMFAVLLGAGVAMVLGSSLDTVLGVFGRDATLSGRTELWSLVWTEVRERPWFGYGYSGFWLGLEGESAPIWRSTGSEVPAADNGFLDLWLSLGLVGVVVFFAGFSAAFLRAATWFRLSRTSEGFWPCLFLTFVLLYSVSESVFLKQNSTLWILYVSTVLSAFPRDALRAERSTRMAHAGATMGPINKPVRAGESHRTAGLIGDKGMRK